MRTVTIYTLAHPITKAVFYVGRTKCSLGARLQGHVHNKDGSFHLNTFIQTLIKTTGHKPLIEAVDNGPYEKRRELEEYWIQQFASWGFDLQNRRHLQNKNFTRNNEKAVWFVKLTEEESELVRLLYRHGDCQALSEICGISNERVRQLLKYRKFSIRYKDAIVQFYKDRARKISQFYLKLVA